MQYISTGFFLFKSIPISGKRAYRNFFFQVRPLSLQLLFKTLRVLKSIYYSAKLCTVLFELALNACNIAQIEKRLISFGGVYLDERATLLKKNDFKRIFWYERKKRKKKPAYFCSGSVNRFFSMQQLIIKIIILAIPFKDYKISLWDVLNELTT